MKSEKDYLTPLAVIVAAFIGGVFLIVSTYIEGESFLLDRSMNAPIVLEGDQGSEAHVAGCENADLKVEDFGLSHEAQFTIPDSVGLCEVIFLHGDIYNKGGCHMKTFMTGEFFDDLGTGIFRLIRITGTPKSIDTEISRRVQALEQWAGSPCIWLQ